MSLSEFSLQDKKALVIGARRNMGKGFALGLAEAGADVAVTDLNTESGQLNAVCEEIKAMPTPSRTSLSTSELSKFKHLTFFRIFWILLSTFQA